MADWYFKLTKSTAKQPYRFNLHAPNHEAILSSENYAAKAGALNGIESVRTNAPLDERYERKRSSDGQYMFNLLAGNHQVIGTSERYPTERARDAGIEVLKRYAPTASAKGESSKGGDMGYVLEEFTLVYSWNSGQRNSFHFSSATPVEVVTPVLRGVERFCQAANRILYNNEHQIHVGIREIKAGSTIYDFILATIQGPVGSSLVRLLTKLLTRNTTKSSQIDERIDTKVVETAMGDPEMVEALAEVMAPLTEGNADRMTARGISIRTTTVSIEELQIGPDDADR